MSDAGVIFNQSPDIRGVSYLWGQNECCLNLADLVKL